MECLTVHKIPLGKLVKHFACTEEFSALREACHSQSLVQFFPLEKGLRASIWNGSFSQSLELFNENGAHNGKRYFVLVYILHSKGIAISDKNNCYFTDLAQDSFLFSSLSEITFIAQPGSEIKALDVSFSAEWLEKMLDNDPAPLLKDKLDAVDDFLKAETMNSEEKSQLQKLMDTCLKNELGSFYIKSAVLKMVSDFFNKLKNRQDSATEKLSLTAVLERTKCYFDDHIGAQSVDVKTLAKQFGTSQSTLRRHFKKRFGVTMSVYLKNKKKNTLAEK